MCRGRSAQNGERWFIGFEGALALKAWLSRENLFCKRNLKPQIVFIPQPSEPDGRTEENCVDVQLTLLQSTQVAPHPTQGGSP